MYFFVNNERDVFRPSSVARACLLHGILKTHEYNRNGYAKKDDSKNTLIIQSFLFVHRNRKDMDFNKHGQI
jgi:hypothetical protein